MFCNIEFIFCDEVWLSWNTCISNNGLVQLLLRSRSAPELGFPVAVVRRHSGMCRKTGTEGATTSSGKCKSQEEICSHCLCCLSLTLLLLFLTATLSQYTLRVVSSQIHHPACYGWNSGSHSVTMATNRQLLSCFFGLFCPAVVSASRSAEGWSDTESNKDQNWIHELPYRMLK